MKRKVEICPHAHIGFWHGFISISDSRGRRYYRAPTEASIERMFMVVAPHPTFRAGIFDDTGDFIFTAEIDG